MATRRNGKPNREGAQARTAGKHRRRRRGRLHLHFILLLLFLFTVGGILSMTVFFKIEEVVVVGADKYSPDEIEEASGIQAGENLFRVDKELVAENLTSRFPYIQSVEIRRKFPPKIEIHVTQETPVGAIRTGNTITFISREGKVLEQGALMIPAEVPVVKGIPVQGLSPGEYLGEEENEKLGMLQYLLDAIETSGFTDVTNVDLSDRLNIRIMYENRFLLELGSEADLAYKLQFVQHVLQHNIEPDETGVIDATDAQQNKLRIFSGAGEEAREYTSIPEGQAEPQEDPEDPGASDSA